MKQQAFWLFQSIDPATLLPPSDPLKGFLLLQDTAKLTSGHGFVNFSIKPKSTAQTGDTISAIASIIFDQNDVIPTNRAKNTIDALPPTSAFNTDYLVIGPGTAVISWNGADDAGGSGVAGYSLYVSSNNQPFRLYQAQLSGNSYLFTGTGNSTYCFFIRAIDSVKNEEPLSNQCNLSITLSGTILPLTWLDVAGVRRNNDALITWVTGNELNVSSFTVERSANQLNFEAIGVLGALGGTNINQYTYTDKNVTALNTNMLFYRIKQTDRNGQVTYSKVVMVKVDKPINEPLITAYPNPFANMITVNVRPAQGSDKTNRIDLVSLNGKIVYSKVIEKNGTFTTQLANIPRLASGIYILKTTVNGIPFVTKVVKQ